MNREEARNAIEESIREIVPDVDFADTPGDGDLRDTFELDSLDFLSFVEALCSRAHCRIDEEDYPFLATMDTAADFLVGRTAGKPVG